MYIYTARSLPLREGDPTLYKPVMSCYTANRTRTHSYQDKDSQLPGQGLTANRTRTHSYQDKDSQLTGQGLTATTTRTHSFLTRCCRRSGGTCWCQGWARIGCSVILGGGETTVNCSADSTLNAMQNTCTVNNELYVQLP